MVMTMVMHGHGPASKGQVDAVKIYYGDQMDFKLLIIQKYFENPRYKYEVSHNTGIIAFFSFVLENH